MRASTTQGLLPSAIQACRDDLFNLERNRAEHAGLALSRYLGAHKPTDPRERRELKQTPEEELLSAVSGMKTSEAYRTAFGRWEKTSPAIPSYERVSLPLELVSSLAIGLGNESPLEVGLTVHHTYGMPVIPGSAIKGMCRRAAQRLLAENKIGHEHFQALFGDQKNASCFIFWDAWYDPSSVDGKPFHRDVITVHHQQYYGSQGKGVWPTDFDDPTPVPFLVVRPGARFLFCIDAPTGWGEFIKNLLGWSLTHLGIGGKTNAGYGYFRPQTQSKTDPADKPQTPPHPFEERKETWENITVTLNPGSGELRAQGPGGQTAIAIGKAAQDLRAALPEEAQQQLTKKHKLQADVEVSIVGNKISIVRVIKVYS